jgi:hypothetical protein
MDPYAAIALGIVGGLVLAILLLAVLRPHAEPPSPLAAEQADIVQLMAVKNVRRRSKGLPELTEAEFRATLGVRR